MMWILKKIRWFLVTMGVLGVALAAPVIAFDLEWVKSYSGAPLYATPSGFLQDGQWAFVDNGIDDPHLTVYEPHLVIVETIASSTTVFENGATTTTFFGIPITKMISESVWQPLDYDVSHLKEVQYIGTASYHEFVDSMGKTYVEKITKARYDALNVKNPVNPVKTVRRSLLFPFEAGAVSVGTKSGATANATSVTFSHTTNTGLDTYLVAFAGCHQCSGINDVTFNGFTGFLTFNASYLGLVIFST